MQNFKKEVLANMKAKVATGSVVNNSSKAAIRTNQKMTNKSLMPI